MSSILSKYKKLPTFDKVFIPACFALLVAVASFFSIGDGLNPFLTGGAVILFAALIHFMITKPYSLAALVVLGIQLLAFMPATYMYALIASSQFEDESAYAAAALYVMAGSYLVAWATWKWGSGRWWFKMLLGFILFDAIVPALFIMTGFPNLFVTMIAGIATTVLVSIPWHTNKKTIEQIPFGAKRGDVTEALFDLVKGLDGTIVTKANSEVTDFMVKKGKRTFHVTVLGQNHSVKMAGDSIQYGPHSIKPLLYQTALESKTRFFNSRNIPVVVNFSDKSKSFLEVNTSLRKEERRGMHVIVTTPPVLIDLIKKS